MNSISCKICRRAYCEEICVPKLLECGHSVCFTCIAGLIQDNERCPTCFEAVSIPLEEYPTNIDLLKISKSYEENCFQEFYSLGNKKSLLMSKRELLIRSIDDRVSLQDATNSLIDNIKELALANGESDNTDVKTLVSYIDRHLELVENVLSADFNLKKQNMFCLSQYKNEQHYLSDLKFRLNGGEIVFACELVGHLGWKYGQVTVSDDRIYIHCLSSSTSETGASLVLLQDLRKCLISKGNIMPFIEFGTEKIVFALTNDYSLATLLLIKVCTGEAGRYLKGCNTKVDEYITDIENDGHTTEDSSKLNRCSIYVPINFIVCVYEQVLIKNVACAVKKDDIVVQCLKEKIYIHKVVDHTYRFYNVVAKLPKDYEIDFKNLENKKVKDCGISFPL